MMEDKLSIRVNIADRYYPLKIERKDEERIRRAAKLINDRILQYKQKYLDKDVQDFLAMAALQYVIKLLECEENSDIDQMLEKLQEVDDELDRYIQRGVI